MIYDLVSPTDPILREEIPSFDFNNPPIDPLDLACDLAETMLHYNGLGLAANQVGLRYNLFVIKANEIIPCYNPRIVDISEETWIAEEGCLTFPDLWVKIKRPRVIKVRYQEPTGNVVTTKFQDLTARIFYHELDHLSGIRMHDRSSRINLEQAINRKKKLDRKNKK